MRLPANTGPLLRVAGLLLPLLLPLVAACTPGATPGAKLYRRNCASCHGVDGGGGIQYQVDAGADLLDDSWVHGSDRQAFERVLNEGLVFEHPIYDFTGQELSQLSQHILELRGE